MIGKPEWFTRRKWAGWGLFPVTWQGWVYVGVVLAAIFGANYIPGEPSQRYLALSAIAAIVLLDTIDIMFRMKKDERETLHEALAERNALWAMILVLVIGVSYEAAVSLAQTGDMSIDPLIIVAIFSGLLVKAATNYYLDKKD